MQRGTMFMNQRPNIVKISILPNLIYKFKENLIKIPAGFCIKTDKLVLKCLQKCKGPMIAKSFLKRSSKMEESHNLFLRLTIKLQHQDSINWHEDKSIKQKNPEIELHMLHGQLN